MPAAVAFRCGGIALGAIIAFVLTYPFSRNMTATYAAHTNVSLLQRSQTDSSARLRGSSHQSIASYMQGKCSGKEVAPAPHALPQASVSLISQGGARAMYR